jgi:hypothetical protein
MDFKEASAAVTGGPGIIELGGTTYLVGQPDDRAFAAVFARIREQRKPAPTPLQLVLPDLVGLPPEDRAIAIKAAVDKQLERKPAAIDPGELEADTQQFLMTPDGAAFLTWLLIRKEQPDTKYETIKPLVTEENYLEVLARLMTASGLEAVAKKKVGTNGSSHGPPPTA